MNKHNLLNCLGLSADIGCVKNVKMSTVHVEDEINVPIALSAFRDSPTCPGLFFAENAVKALMERIEHADNDVGDERGRSCRVPESGETIGCRQELGKSCTKLRRDLPLLKKVSRLGLVVRPVFGW